MEEYYWKNSLDDDLFSTDKHQTGNADKKSGQINDLPAHKQNIFRNLSLLEESSEKFSAHVHQIIHHTTVSILIEEFLDHTHLSPVLLC